MPTQSRRLFFVVLVITLVSESIGTREIQLGPGRLIALPLLYAFFLGMAVNPVVRGKSVVGLDTLDVTRAGGLVVLSISPLIARFGTIMGSSMEVLRQAGPALAVQELGNLATVAIALPVAVLVFGMGREAIGACFSVAREPNLAIISERFGLKSPEGSGVMAVYVLGTVLGTVVFAGMASFLESTNLFDPRALAMACGVGSGSMMTACAGALARSVPVMADEILALAVASNLLTYATGLYAALFIALPVTERLYAALNRIRGRGDARDPETSRIEAPVEEQAQDLAQTGAWRRILSDLGLISLLLWAGHAVARKEPSLSSLGGILTLELLVLAGLWLTRRLRWGLPSVAWISFIGILASLELTPWAGFVKPWFDSVDVLATATPCLAYAGIAISKNEMRILRTTSSSISMVVVALLVFGATYLGSALLAEAMLGS